LKILLTNDDGIHAPGLWAAARALSAVGEVAVVAPDREQSGVGASMTLHAPLFVHSVPAEQYLSQFAPGDDTPPRSADAVRVPALDTTLTLPHPISAWAVQGTPADACILALEQLVTPKPDLVVSGINRGSNLGWDVIVSGTVGAAVQGWVRGYPTIAISVGSVQAPRYQLAARVVAHLARRLADAPEVSPAYFLNVNVPNEPADRIAGVKVTRLGGRAYGESVRAEESFGHRRYWISRNRPVLAGGEGSDIAASKANYIGITPMGMAFSTTDERVEMVQGLVEGLQLGAALN
jgi:5'-nucleotidase